MANDTRDPNRDQNRDPITGAPGAHPVGTGVGAAGGGVAGAAIGSAAGPVGTAVGAAVGAIAGGLAGKGVAERIDPTAENQHWEQNYRSESYVKPDYTYQDYGPAYRTGYESRARYEGRDFDEVESDLRNDYETRYRGDSRLEWQDAREATRAAWHRVERAMPGDADGDGR
ncbi:hypothetical protein LY625_08005 [Lysobacter sp. GX 14042]|uniref:glycine zipper domain-containing protein n=1 Tax=Lysobacter sp. GX 14042 TaxID=2907155 RepID=UPI001F253DF6|nr:glycine zipper domain-containing protein [Lysobacter sp. GX 14042]MCE7032554.1 hypothetical protein [Lysobacter sp. GX 14042]